MLRIFRVFVPTSIVALLLCEAVILYACYVGGVFLAERLFDAPGFAQFFFAEEHGFSRLAIVVATVMFGLYFNDLYDHFHIRSRIALIQQICLALGVAFLTQAVMGYVSSGWIVPRYSMILGSGIVLVVLLPWRIFYASAVFKALGAEQVLFLGSSSLLQAIAARLRERPALGINIIGYLDDGGGEADPLPGIPRLGTVGDLKSVTENRPDRIIVGLSERRKGLPFEELLDLRFAGVRIEQATRLYETTFGRICAREFRPSDLIFASELGPQPLNVFLQTIYCTVLAAILLVVFSPFMLAAALMVKFTSPGPILFRQKRVGRDDRVFTLFKFRSMYEDAEQRTGAVWAVRNDPRITPAGRFLRQSRLDELPQLYNVLKGDMALAGPRPERPEFVRTLTEKIPYYRQRHCVKPGITGWAQINYKYGDTAEDTLIKLEYDLYYIKNISLSLDAFIFFHTLKTMLLSRGAQ
jgi:sugar transferase (PEP-CTERM system associated)